jgi:peroxiredoxin
MAAYPQSYIIDRDGSIAHAWTGKRTAESMETLEKLVRELGDAVLAISRRRSGRP